MVSTTWTQLKGMPYKMAHFDNRLTIFRACHRRPGDKCGKQEDPVPPIDGTGEGRRISDFETSDEVLQFVGRLESSVDFSLIWPMETDDCCTALLTSAISVLMEPITTDP